MISTTDPRTKNVPMVPSLVHFFGPDGSGKTLQATVLTCSLKRGGFKASRCWLRAHHTLAFLTWKLLVKIGFYRTVPNEFGVVTRIPAVNRSRFLSFFWGLVEFVSVLPIILRFKLKILRGYHLVAERYILDTVTSIAYILEDAHFLNGGISRLLFRMIPQNSVFIFLDSDYSTIRRRRLGTTTATNSEVETGTNDTRRSSYVEPKEFIAFQRTAYKALATSFNAFTIDTSKSSIQKTSNDILRYLELPSSTRSSGILLESPRTHAFIGPREK